MKNAEIKNKFLPGKKIWWKSNCDPYRGTYTYNEGIVVSVLGKNIEVDTGGTIDWIYYPDYLPQIKT